MGLQEDVPLRVEFQKWWTQLQGWNQNRMRQEILLFKVTKPKISSEVPGLEEGYSKVQFVFGRAGQDLEPLLSLKMEEMGWVLKIGAPPQSTKERKLSGLMKKIITK